MYNTSNQTPSLINNNDNDTVTIYGKFFPSHGNLGTPCYKEAESRERRIPIYGTSLFGVYLMRFQNNPVAKVDSSTRSDSKPSQRLVIELSVRFNDNPVLDPKEANWNSLITNSDSSWMENIELGKFYAITLPDYSFFLKSKRNESIEETLRKFTRQSKTKWGGTAVSYVVKADANQVTQYELISNVIPHQVRIGADEARLQLLDLVPAEVASQTNYAVKTA